MIAKIRLENSRMSDSRLKLRKGKVLEYPRQIEVKKGENAITPNKRLKLRGGEEE